MYTASLVDLHPCHFDAFHKAVFGRAGSAPAQQREQISQRMLVGWSSELDLREMVVNNHGLLLDLVALLSRAVRKSFQVKVWLFSSIDESACTPPSSCYIYAVLAVEAATAAWGQAGTLSHSRALQMHFCSQLLEVGVVAGGALLLLFFVHGWPVAVAAAYRNS